MDRLSRWIKMSADLKLIKAQEADLRRELCAEIIADAQMKKGRCTVKSELEGRTVKAVQTLGYTIDEAALASIWEALSETDKTALKMKPTLKLAQYKKLSEYSLLHEAVISKLAMPTLEVAE